ncbi:hypothetical protein OG897_06615 [Streptomyces sp. NBC_00237]|uniref:hypothetical protein n=1 Tax=Streptomyces sp. NBC_00237 TaxID=2975687 RepID=UPI00224F2057|nr:hypothetical protein [Streptomyces sp. NBC_00237]MCX5201134.1 hypothetical protein [Streptomyces sp. NBC_00237]
MSEIAWEEPFCGEGASCFRLGTDDAGNGYIAVLGAEGTPLTDTREALRNLILDIKAGRADHLL